jgi:hypothetical protein
MAIRMMILAGKLLTFPPSSSTNPLLSMTYRFLVPAAAALAFAADVSAQGLLISQYYEGTSNNKFLELWNPTNADIPLEGIRLTLWSNANRENWKLGTGGPTASFNLGSIAPGIVLKPGQFLLLANPSVAVPAYAVANADAKPSASGQQVINFNGDDSVVLYASDVYLPENVLDAFSLAGNNGADKTFYRISTAKGWNTDPGSQSTDVPDVWAPDKTLADVASATSADLWYLAFQPDTLPPVLETFTVANDLLSTPTRGVVLSYTTTGGNPLSFRVSENADFAGAEWLPYAPSARTFLSENSGAKRLYFQVRNDSGTSSVLSDDIDLTAFAPASATVKITQYYEGSGNAKFLEITNTGTTEADLSGWTLMRWTNQNAEDYKFAGTGTGTPSQPIPLTALVVPETLTPVLPPGATIVLSNNNSNTPPGGAQPALVSGNLSHNGNDSLALYSGPVDPNNLVDVIGFTDLGNEGADKSFVRTGTGQGFSFEATSNVTGFPAVWTETALAIVDAALPGENTHLGTYPGGGPIGYDAWAVSAFPAGTDPAATAFDADPDKDGVPNGAEYYTSGNPLAGSAAFSAVTGSASQLTLTYRRARSAPGVTASWQWSRDLQSWFASGEASPDGASVFFGAAQIVDGGEPGFDTVSTTAEISGSATRIYVRLKVTRP